MCGILGYIGDKEATKVLVDGLRKLEYRGYDSSGVAILEKDHFEVRRAVGKLGALETLLGTKPAKGSTGLGHTRWATHGAPSEMNAHPHMDDAQNIVVVHNGIIENYQPLKKTLIEKGIKFHSETDTEVAAQLIGFYWKELSKTSKTKETFVEAVKKALKDIRGTFALGVMCTALPNFIVGARRDCPLIVGLGENEKFLASDVPAILSYTRDVIFLEDGDIVILDGNNFRIIDIDGHELKRTTSRVAWDPVQAEKAGYKHFMLKEIHEQPRIVEDTLRGRLNAGLVTIDTLNLTDDELRKLTRVRFIACGTSWHASLVGAFYLEKYAGIPATVDIASEFRYRDPIVEPGTLMIAVSQSGETADTLAAGRLAKKKGAKLIAISNVVGSTLTRDADGLLMTHCARS
jgi:glucosamine--fructose-6-phosphate aminotransferase (isomerizing)